MNVTRDSLAEKIVHIMFQKRAFEEAPLTEQYLTEQLEIGRSPIRDALKTLENDDLIERRKKKGVFLKKPTPKTISDLYDLRTALESFAIARATDAVTVADLDALERAANEFDIGRRTGDYIFAESANIDFHTKIIELSQNGMLIRMMRNFNIIRKAFLYAYSLQPVTKTFETAYSHLDIIRALRTRDPEECVKKIREHILVGKKRMLEQALGIKIDS